MPGNYVYHRNKVSPIPPPPKSNNKSLLNTFSEGLAFGAGSQIAHTAINSVLNKKEVKIEPQKTEVNLDKNNIYKIYEECINRNNEYHKEECYKILEDISKN